MLPELLKITEISETDNFIDVTLDNRKYIVTKSELWSAIFNVQLWQYEGGSNFGVKLVELIAKADENNKRKILKGFPEYVVAYLLWFYKEYGEVKFNDDDEFFSVIKLKLQDFVNL